MTTMFCSYPFDIHTFHSHKQFVNRPFHSHKQFVNRPFHSRTALSSLAITNAHTQSLFSHFASTKYNLSEDDITHIFRMAPYMQKLRTLHNVERLIHNLKKRGFTDVEIANIMRNRPSIIGLSESILEPKIELLEAFGFEDRILRKLLTLNTHILSISLLKGLLPKMEFLKNVFQSQDVLVKALLRAPKLLSCDLEKTLKPSLAFWEGLGLSREELSKFLVLYPRLLTRSSLTPAQAVLIKNIGLDKRSKMFKYVLSAITVSRMETLEAKIENLKFWGLSAEEVWRVIRVAPVIINFSKENVSEKMNFVVNHMGVPANSIVKHTHLFYMNLELYLMPRFLVWQKIKSTVGSDISVFKVLRMPEGRFIDKIIKGQPDSETLWTIYETAISGAPNSTKRLSRLRQWESGL